MLQQPLAIQFVLDDKYWASQKEIFSFLAKKGFKGVELNIPNPELISKDELKSFLDSFGLKMSMFASGLSAKVNQLSLSSSNQEQRKKSIEKCCKYIDFASSMGSDGIIFGFIKGGVAEDKQKAKELFIESLSQLAPEAEAKKVKLLVEATNRYESSIANSIEDGVKIVQSVGSDALKVLPDTFHMNIEEKDMYAALCENLAYYVSVHISDNNRLLPGHGAMDFNKIISLMNELGFKGWLAMEGNMPNGVMNDTETTMKYFDSLS